MTVEKLAILLERLISENKGGYEVTCESFCVAIEEETIEIDDDEQSISL